MWGRDSGTCSGCWHLYFCRMRSLRLRFYTILDLPLSDGYQFLSSSVSCIYRDGPQSQDQYGNNVWQNDVTMNAYSWFKFSTSRGESWSHCLLHCTQLYGPIWATVHIIQMNTAAADTLCVCCWNEALFKTVESLWLQLMIDLSENRKTMQLFESCVGSDCLEKEPEPVDLIFLSHFGFKRNCLSLLRVLSLSVNRPLASALLSKVLTLTKL